MKIQFGAKSYGEGVRDRLELKNERELLGEIQSMKLAQATIKLEIAKLRAERHSSGADVDKQIRALWEEYREVSAGLEKAQVKYGRLQREKIASRQPEEVQTETAPAKESFDTIELRDEVPEAVEGAEEIAEELVELEQELLKELLPNGPFK